MTDRAWARRVELVIGVAWGIVHTNPVLAKAAPPCSGVDETNRLGFPSDAACWTTACELRFPQSLTVSHLRFGDGSIVPVTVERLVAGAVLDNLAVIARPTGLGQVGRAEAILDNGGLAGHVDFNEHGDQPKDLVVTVREILKAPAFVMKEGCQDGAVEFVVKGVGPSEVVDVWVLDDAIGISAADAEKQQPSIERLDFFRSGDAVFSILTTFGLQPEPGARIHIAARAVSVGGTLGPIALSKPFQVAFRPPVGCRCSDGAGQPRMLLVGLVLGLWFARRRMSPVNRDDRQPQPG